MLLRLQQTIGVGLLLTASSLALSAQVQPAKTPEAKPSPAAGQAAKVDPKNFTAEQIAEATIFIYGNGGGRTTLSQIRKTTLERGSTALTDAAGKTERINYQRFVIRGESIGKEKIRLDQELPSARFSLVFSAGKIFGIYNNTVFPPREDTAKAFENQIVRGIEALLRYKENESTLTLAAKEKHMGVDYHVIDVTDKESRKTRFYISAKSFRVMMLTYDEAGVTYKRKFYDYNYAQGTLVPFRTVLWAGDKQVEETEVGTITFGQKVDEGLFTAG